VFPGAFILVGRARFHNSGRWRVARGGFAAEDPHLTVRLDLLQTEIILEHFSCGKVGNVFTLGGCPGSDLSYMKENEDDVRQTLNYNIHKLLIRGESNADIVAVILQHFMGLIQ